MRAWNARTVPVGRRLARLAALDKVLWTEPVPCGVDGPSKGPLRGSLFIVDCCDSGVFTIADLITLWNGYGLI